ncbi:hypothetical protein CJT77_14375 [Pseudomonas aeruginosa]|nr:hypothetical protein CJT77_14375 [Pseudomonas aeruginosa]
MRLRGRDRLGHAGVKVKWEPVEARHGVNAQAEAQTEWKMVGDAETAPWKHSLRLNPGNASCRRSAPATPNHACGRRKQGSPLVIKAKAAAPCSAGVTPASPAPIPRL